MAPLCRRSFGLRVRMRYPPLAPVFPTYFPLPGTTSDDLNYSSMHVHTKASNTGEHKHSEFYKRLVAHAAEKAPARRPAPLSTSSPETVEEREKLPVNQWGERLQVHSAGFIGISHLCLTQSDPPPTLLAPAACHSKGANKVNEFGAKLFWCRCTKP